MLIPGRIDIIAADILIQLAENNLPSWNLLGPGMRKLIGNS
jgi:hypothetical protein